MDTAIVDATVWTGHRDHPGVVVDTTIGIEGAEIAYVGPREGLPSEPDRRIKGDDLLVTPGLIDAHAHTGLGLARGLAQDVPEIEWMDRALGPVGAELTDADVVAGSRLGVLEAVTAGVTTMCEYASEVRELIEAVHRPAGIRTVAVETINEVATRPNDGGTYELSRAAGAEARERNEALFAYADGTTRVEAMYGPQALDMVTLETMDELVGRARDRNRRLHMHVAQGGREREQLRDRYGVTSAVALLDENGWMDEHLVCAHLHGASGAERAQLAEAGATMVGCPGSIGGIDGIAPPISEFREADGVAAVGSDQAPGGGGGHVILAELNRAAMFAKIESQDPTALPAWEALRLATADAAAVLGIDDIVGTIEVGKRADLACFDLTAPPLVPSPTAAGATPIANLVAAGPRARATHVLVDGEFVVRDGHCRTLDPGAIAAQADELAQALHERAREPWRAAGSRLATESVDGAFSVRSPDQ